MFFGTKSSFFTHKNHRIVNKITIFQPQKKEVGTTTTFILIHHQQNYIKKLLNLIYFHYFYRLAHMFTKLYIRPRSLRRLLRA